MLLYRSRWALVPAPQLIWHGCPPPPPPSLPRDGVLTICEREGVNLPLPPPASPSSPEPSPPYKAPRLCMSWRSWTVPWRCSAPPGHSPGCGQPLRWGCCPLYTAGTLWCDTARRVGSGCGGTRPGGYRTPLRGCSRCGQPGWACCQNWTRPGVRQTCDVVAAAVGLWRASPRPAYSS